MIFTTFARVVQENSGDWTGINRELLFPDSYTTSFKARMHLKYFNMSSSCIKHSFPIKYLFLWLKKG